MCGMFLEGPIRGRAGDVPEGPIRAGAFLSFSTNLQGTSEKQQKHL